MSLFRLRLLSALDGFLRPVPVVDPDWVLDDEFEEEDEADLPPKPTGRDLDALCMVAAAETASELTQLSGADCDTAISEAAHASTDWAEHVLADVDVDSDGRSMAAALLALGFLSGRVAQVRVDRGLNGTGPAMTVKRPSSRLLDGE